MTQRTNFDLHHWILWTANNKHCVLAGLNFYEILTSFFKISVYKGINKLNDEF